VFFASQAFVTALLVTLLVAGVNLLRTRFHKVDATALAICVVISTLINWLLVWAVLYGARPILVGPLGGYIWILLPLFAAWAVFALGDLILSNVGDRRLSLGTGLVLVPLVMLSMAIFWGCKTHVVNQGAATHLASLLVVEEQPADAYPDTDTNHMVLVPEDTAIFKASQVIASGSDESGRNLGSVYEVGEPVLQSVRDHLYWIADLEFAGWRVWMQTGQVVPGYIAVDAEDPDAQAQLHLGFAMKYVPSAYHGNKLERHLYTSGFQRVNVDDITIEIDDEWRPWYTASLNKPQVGTQGNVPFAMIVVDPATGEAVRYGLDETPAWIDRVYSAHTVRDMVNWWGNYADSNWKLIGRTKANRFQVVGDPVLVYTKGGHPDWQVVISSLNDDNSITGVMLVNGRTGKARLFPSLAGTPIPEDVLHTFQNARDTIKNFRPRHLSMHLIFGEPTWVVSYITPAHDGDDTPGEPFQGIGLLPARDVNGSNVVFAKTKEAAFAQYLTVLAHQSSTDAPSEKRAVEETSGTVREVVQQIEEGNTFYLIWLNEDAAHVFRAARNVSVELPFVKPGDTVTVQYIDVGEVVVNVARFNDLAVPFVP